MPASLLFGSNNRRRLKGLASAVAASRVGIVELHIDSLVFNC